MANTAKFKLPTAPHTTGVRTQSRGPLGARGAGGKRRGPNTTRRSLVAHLPIGEVPSESRSGRSLEERQEQTRLLSTYDAVE